MIKGIYFDGETSSKKDVTLYYKENGLIGFENFNVNDVSFDSVSISSRVGNTPRYINFQNGSLFETNDNAAVDAMVELLSKNSFLGLAHKLESTKSIILLTVITVILFTWSFIQFGIPLFSKQIAEHLPDDASQHMGKGVLEAMDKSWFSKSNLSEERKKRLRVLFKDLLQNIEGNKNIELIFRKGGKIRANAFALPNGTIVLTDELINLAENDLEIVSIMLHEIGHLENKHSLRAAVQQFSLAMFMMAITGDVSTSSSIITAIPVMLVESGFSQEMETEADTYSLGYMIKHNIKTEFFASMMEKLEASYMTEYTSCIEENINTIQCITNAVKINKEQISNENDNLIDYFSTHPASKERISRFLNN